ncbi:DUF2569 domain-containing protein [Paenibacillus aquistagni]|uniref:DUF2569 domain-containing protein n=1 Tax=Paenibacillus aquistagni TaxID=1852522 RepID=A0A1X7IZF3_9BACL|nr:DUF2569 domain-containing protein [Paenibacillus aquistagni]SMG19843.1 Protein of unknown function [Paenibacillus aquistagni]
MKTTINEIRNDNLRLGVSGLGGWLILIQIGLYLTLIGLIILIRDSFYNYSDEIWQLLSTEGTIYYHPLWRPIFIFESIYNILFFIFTITILVQFYRKKSIVPRLMIIFYSLSLLIGIFDYIMMQQIPLARELEAASSIRDLIKSTVTCLIWIPYFLKSERVMNTFVR